MFVGDAETPPVFVQLASYLDDDLKVLRSLVGRLQVDTLVRILVRMIMITIGADHGSKKAEAINLIQKRILRVRKIWNPKS